MFVSHTGLTTVESLAFVVELKCFQLISDYYYHLFCHFSDIICPKLPSLEHGRTFAPYHNSIHQRVRFQCDSGYRLVGYMFAECQKVGKWSNDLPQCVPENGNAVTFVHED